VKLALLGSYQGSGFQITGLGAIVSFAASEASNGVARAPATAGDRRLVVIGLGIAMGYLCALAAMFVRHQWMIDAAGRPMPTDFMEIWSAGRLALHGAALSAYDGRLQHAAEAAAIGHDFQGFYSWSYPPGFLFAAAAAASLPYALAFAVWIAGGLALHGFSIAAITRRPAAMVLAFASPWALACALVGQNGFITAGLIGLVLSTMEKRPVLSGLLLGLLTYKPQFGLLFPLVLLLSGRWKVFAFAAISALGLLALSAVVFGAGTLAAFLHGLPEASQTLVTNGAAGWGKLQSLYGLARCLGGSDLVGWTVQGLMSAACALGVAVVWRSQAPFALKAAALAVATVLVTPYVFAYDLPVLAVPVAFLYRQRRFDRLEYLGLALAALTVVPFAFAAVPSGLVASLAVAAIVARRLAAWTRENLPRFPTAHPQRDEPAATAAPS
jgi:arabinofuranan 3-O-arabinosyltransferase